MNIYFVNTISLFTGGKHPFPQALAAAAADAAVRPSDLCRNQLKLRFGKILFPKEDEYKEICYPKAVQIYVSGPARPPTYVYAAFRSHISL